MSKFVAHYFCINCDRKLSFNTVMNSNGVCPHCGFKSGCTVIDTIVRSAKWIRTSNIFFWKGYWEYPSIKLKS